MSEKAREEALKFTWDRTAAIINNLIERTVYSESS